MREETGLFVCRMSLLICDGMVTLIAEFGDRVGDRVIQAAVERSELIYLKRRIALVRQVCDGLAQVTVVVNHLVDRKSKLE